MKTRASDLGFWPLQCMGWVAWCLVGMLAELPLHEGPWIYLYWVVSACVGFIASAVLRAFYQHLLKRKYGWQKLFGIAVATCYLLALICSATTVIVERAIRGKIAHPFPWKEFLSSSFADSIGTLLILVAWSAIYLGVKQWQSSALKEERLLVLESMARDAELRALRYQITPHFLFNTLNGISTLVGEGNNESAREMIALLGDFLRTTLEASSDGDVTLHHEMSHMRQYLAIEQVRLGDRLRLEIDVSPVVESALVPNLLLQPLIENAIQHGVAQCTGNGLLRIHAEREDRFAVVSVANTVERYADGAAIKMRTRKGMGLENTRNRLAARYGSTAELAVRQDGDNLWRVILRFPFEDEG